MIVDCFPYFKEKEILELRIKLLHNYVDKFIICDGNHTQSGIPKEYTCKNTLSELGINSDKIVVIEVDMPSLQDEKDSWVRERMQRNAAAPFIEDGAVCFVGDCDEIINPKFINYYASVAEQYPNKILRVHLVYLNGRADLRVYDEFGNPRKWHTAFMCLSSHLKTCTLSDIRESYAMQKFNIPFSDIFITNNGKMEDAGWHFSWMGNSEILKEKSKSSMHVQDYVIDSIAQFGTEEMMQFLSKYKPEENSTDPLGRKNHILKKYPLENLPSLIFDIERIKNFLLP
jgi:beta-1,4-mannosyl-glycoprotein beta-1,4-N-acetylglucosaminyltransferase